jgi:uncharacterized protein YecE (DUF72 family)
LRGAAERGTILHHAGVPAFPAYQLPRFSNCHTKLLEITATQTKQTTETISNRYKIATPHRAMSGRLRRAGILPAFLTFSPSKKICNIPLRFQTTRSPFLIGTPKRLEIAVTLTKQNTEGISNRDKIRPLGKAVQPRESNSASRRGPEWNSFGRRPMNLTPNTARHTLTGRNLPKLAQTKMPPRKTRAASAPRRILVGPAGWSYADWKGIVYPTRRPKGFHEAQFLSQYFDTIEINTSFYNPARPDLCRQWLAQVSANPRFLFTAKLWQRFTHETGATAADVAAVRAGFDVLAEGNRLGAVLLQFPFSFHNTEENFSRLDVLAKEFAVYPLVVEVRHASWMVAPFFAWLRERGVGFCNIDQPVIGKSVKPTERATSRIGYVRLHGRRYDTWFTDNPETPASERYNYLYSEEELAPWTERIQKTAAHAETTFVITNNHFEGKGIVNALELVHLLSNAKVSIPETLRHHYPRLEKIADQPSSEPTLFPV